MQNEIELKKGIKALDLALRAARKRCSPRSGFVHLFYGDEGASDTIPLFENFCFIFVLFRQKTAEAVLEGRGLLERLLSFQAPNGNFPVYLHEYPSTWDQLLFLKIAPVLIQILRCFGPVVPQDSKEKIEKALSRGLAFTKTLSLSPLWQHRYSALLGKPTSSMACLTAEEWFETLVSEQLLNPSPLQRDLPFHRGLQVFIGEAMVQERGGIQPLPIEWICAQGDGYSERLLKDHPNQIRSALLFPIELESKEEPSFIFAPQKNGGFYFLWGRDRLHSLSCFSGEVIERGEGRLKVLFDFNGPLEDLSEVSFFVNISPEIEMLIEGQKGTVFRLGQTVAIQSGTLRINAKFTLIEGNGDFCGQISRANRPTHIASKMYEVFDWKISLRTLRRASPCKIELHLCIEH